MAELLRRDFIAALAPQGAPNMDIVVTDVDGTSLCGIQVKTRRNIGSDGGWHMRPKHEMFSEPRIFYVFVDLGSTLNDDLQFFVIPTSIVSNAIRESHQAWLSRPGKNGHIRKDSTVRRLLPDYSKAWHPDETPYPAGWLEEYRDAWSLLTELT
ncbi:hypothetical protein BFP76_04155 [Amylibacter kogurei]|uniref:Aspartate ammonia-lyase n=2 Tax=Paramylibacter kogurei TaxID=1889778 RepID=A0A2G5K5L7_9RHOB|nr:hypothetical protein BFP76_04155 [Amylibacter kogurei]